MSDSSSSWNGGGRGGPDQEVVKNNSQKVSTSLLKNKMMRQTLLRSSPGGKALMLDLLLLLKDVPAGVMSRVTVALAGVGGGSGNANFVTGSGNSGEPRPPTEGTVINKSNTSSEGSATVSESKTKPNNSSSGDKDRTAADSSNGGGGSDNPKNPEKNKDAQKNIRLTPLSTPIKKASPPLIIPPIQPPSSVLRNVIEINSENNRVIDSKMLPEITREQLLSSSQEEEVFPSTLSSEDKKFIKEDKDKPHPKPELSKFLETNLYWQNIESRTKLLVSLVSKSTSSKHNLITHLDELFSHIYQHTETRSTAVESGAVKVLAKIMKTNEGETVVVNRTREILALLGNNPPTKGQGIKILAIDGGGVRGLVALEVLRALERITGKRTYELFDYICGVSTGSILAFLLGAHKKSLDDAEVLYKELSREIFSQNSFMGSAALLWSHSYYHTPTFEKILKKHCGEMPLITHARDPTLPRVSAISTVVNQERVCPYVFRTYALPPMQRPKYLGGCRYHMWEAVRASAAAPTYFEEFKLGNYLHQDGGVLCNNPTSVAISEAKTIWKDQPLQAVVSLGTGLMLSSRTDKNLNDLIEKEGLSYLSWKGKFLKVLDSATDTESVHNTLNELLPHSIYFRLNPYLSEVVRLDEASPEKLDRVQLETRAYLERNVEKVQFACKTLLREKGVGKRWSTGGTITLKN